MDRLLTYGEQGQYLMCIVRVEPQNYTRYQVTRQNINTSIRVIIGARMIIYDYGVKKCCVRSIPASLRCSTTGIYGCGLEYLVFVRYLIYIKYSGISIGQLH